MFRRGCRQVALLIAKLDDLSQVQDDELVERVTGRRLDPETGEIYHMKFKKPPPEIVHRLTQRSDDTEEKLRTRLATHHNNVKDVIGYYTHELVEASFPALYQVCFPTEIDRLP